MKRISASLRFVAGSASFLFFILLSPAIIHAAVHHVPDEFATIQDAISSPTFTPGDSIVVAPGVYFGPINLPNNITINGTETAQTFLSGNGGAAMILDGTANAGALSPGSVNIRNFTFVNATTGISVLNNTSNYTNVSITNNVFNVGPGGTAIIERNSTLTRVANNTFFQNGTALACDYNINIFNNIFSDNTIAIADTAPPATITQITNNAFFGNLASDFTGTNSITGDPLFADLASDPRDFHLREGSPCIGTGNNSSEPNDIGAYGGSFADTIPFPVSNLNITSATDTSISLSWSPNYSYLVTNSTSTSGGYRLYFGSASGTYDCTIATCGEDSPINVGPVTSYTLTSLITPSTPPSAPINVQSTPRDSRLVLTWSAVPGATGYKVHFGISSLDENEPLDAGGNTSYELSGLTNGQHYLIAVSAYAQQSYYFAVTAYDNQFKDSSSTPLHESDLSKETSTRIGSIQESGLSTVISDFPEAVVTYPALPDSGGRCFIATAAYGYYSAPEVQALRVFRDRYLLPSTPGRMFVQWYYRHGPAAAAILNNHPGYKPLVRAALEPAVGVAVFMTSTSILCKAVVFMVLGAAIAYGFLRKRPSRTGGLR
jgi:hypothetical protein